MAKINVVFKSWKKETPNRGYWDHAFIEAIFERDLWKPVRGYEYVYHDDFVFDLDNIHGAIVVIPARYHSDQITIDKINRDIEHLEWVLVMLVGDEEAIFPSEKLYHKNMKIHVMTPHMGKHKNADRFMVNGWTPKTREFLKKNTEEASERPLDWFFAGQVTHSRREKSVKAMRKMENGKLVETPGFTQGINHEEYHKHMASAKVVPCPSGAVIPDSFRMYEALEAGCLPFADGKAPKLKVKGYWNFLFGEDNLPFPVITDWRTLKGLTQYHVDTYPLAANKTFSWWQKYKRQTVYDLEDDVHTLSKIEVNADDVNDKITVLVPTSPTKSNPSTKDIEETIGTVREKLPTAEIIIMIDGVREEQQGRAKKYHEYIKRLLWKCNFEWKNVLPLVFDSHHHQVAMTREALKLVKTPTILFVEHDTPLCEEIPFDNLVDAVIGGDANMIRLHHEALILDVHKHLMLDEIPQTVKGVQMTRTAQWSQRPHVASTDYYKDMLHSYFSSEARCMIEDGIHGKLAEAFASRGQVGWNEFKVWIYTPISSDIKRSYHIDGRQGDSKFDDKFIY